MTKVDTYHDEAMEFAECAFLASKQGRYSKAQTLFGKALNRELLAIDEMGATIIEPTFSILHRSAATLALDCKKPRLAEKLAARALAEDPPSWLVIELWQVLEQARVLPVAI